MKCPEHGEGNPEWTTCPWCIRKQRSTRENSSGTTSPPPPVPLSARPDVPVSGFALSPAADVTRGAPGLAAAQADVTRGAPAYNRPAAADVTRGAGAHDVRGFGPAVMGPTRIIEPPPSGRRKLRAWLIQKEGPRPDQVFQLQDGETWIGRNPHCDIFLDEDSVSGQHAKLWVDEGRVLRLLNVSTSNGTKVNGKRVEAPVDLWENDEIAIGGVVLVLKRIDEPARAAQTAVTPPRIADTVPMPRRSAGHDHAGDVP